ncbi:MAG: leucine-rich repeat domain-containing protein [Microcoleaceae cyanobacterium]
MKHNQLFQTLSQYVQVGILGILIAFGLGIEGYSQETQSNPTGENFATFADWCRNRENLNPEAKRTVSLILQQAGTYNCGRASQNVQEISQLDLSTSQVSDVRPLQSLDNLVELKLINNRISDVTPLQSLDNLEVLDLSYNQISNITPLSSLTKLEVLNLSYNQVNQVESLQSLMNLNELNLSNNQVSDITPLKPLDRLIYLFIRDNPITDQTCPVQPKYVCQF